MKNRKILLSLLTLATLGGVLTACDNGNNNNPDLDPKTEDVTEVTIESIKLTSSPTKLTYKVGESFDPSGMVIEVTFSDKTKGSADLSKCSFSNITETSTSVIVSYEGFTIEVPITIEKEFDPIPYLNGLTEIKSTSKEKLSSYLKSTEGYSEANKTLIGNIVNEGLFAIDLAETANEVVDLLFLYEGKIDEVPNQKQEVGINFINSMIGEVTSTGYNSKDMLSVDKNGTICFYSKMNWGKVLFGSASNNPYKVFDCDITIDYESTTWGSCDMFVNHESSYNNYDILLKHTDTVAKKKVNNLDTTVQSNKGFSDMKKYHMVVITDGDRKMVLQNGEVLIDFKDSTYNVGMIGFSLWQTALYFENYKYKEYTDENALKADYADDLAKELPVEEELDAAGFLDKYCPDTSNYTINDKDEIVCATSAYNRHTFGESTGNNFETFEFELTPTYNADSSYIQIDFRKQDDNKKYVIVLTPGKIRIDRRKYDGGQVRETVLPTYSSDELASGKKLHFKILCSGWYLTVALNGKHLYTNSTEKEYNSGPFGIDAGNTPYILANPVIKKFESQDSLVALNPDLWASSYKEEFVK